MTDLSIITVSYKGWDRLRKSLDSLSSFQGAKITTEVIIVDNNSDDGTLSYLESHYPSVIFIRSSVNGGFAHGCNLGAGMAKGEYLLFLNPDTIASENALEKMLETARNNPDISILSCRQVNENGKESISSGEFPELWNLTGLIRAIFKSNLIHDARRTTQDKHIIPDSHISAKHPAPGTPHLAPCTLQPAPCNTNLSFPDWVSGSVILIRKELFQKIGGFDEDFWMYFEDVDICKRVTDRGGKIASCNTVTIEHNHGGSSRINIRTAALTKTEVHISRHIYMSKHKMGSEKILIQTFLVVNNLISAGIMGLAGVLLFFIPKIAARTAIFIRLISYYSNAAISCTWISRRSVNRGVVKNH